MSERTVEVELYDYYEERFGFDDLKYCELSSR